MKKSFNLTQKRPQGYDQPDGMIVSWNDISSIFCEYFEKINSSETSQSNEFSDLVESEQRALRLRNNWSGHEKDTPVGHVYAMFAKCLTGRIADGYLAIFARYGAKAPAVEDMPESFFNNTLYGIYLPLDGMTGLLKEIREQVASDPLLLKGVARMQEFFKAVEEKAIDYSSADLTPVNAPVAHNQLKNTFDDRLQRVAKAESFKALS